MRATQADSKCVHTMQQCLLPKSTPIRADISWGRCAARCGRRPFFGPTLTEDLDRFKEEGYFHYYMGFYMGFAFN